MRPICTAALTTILLFASTSIQAQDVINLLPGDVIADNTDIADGTIVNVLGGTIGLGVDLANGELNIESGNVAVGATGIPTGFTNTNNLVSVSGGTVGGFFQVATGTQLDVTGGQLESFGVFSGSTANISGGVVTRFPDIYSTGEVNISGGDIFAVRVFSGGEVNFFGTEFFLDGQEINLNLNEETVIDTRDVTLSGLLEDGSFIETSLNTTFGGFNSDNPDGAAAGARVTVTRVAVAVPEPSSIVLAMIGLLPLVRRRKIG